MGLTDFYKSTSKKFDVYISYADGIIPNISNDTLTFYLKQLITDSIYVLTASADVTTNGTSGTGSFNLTATETDINPNFYNYEIVWVVSGSNDEYVLDQNRIQVKERIEN